MQFLKELSAISNSDIGTLLAKLYARSLCHMNSDDGSLKPKQLLYDSDGGKDMF
jgi:hypothetical protein